MIVRVIVAAVIAGLMLACKGDTGPEGPPGPEGLVGPQGKEGATGDKGIPGDIGPPGIGWADAGADLYSTNDGNVGIGINAPTTKLDVGGAITAHGDLITTGNVNATGDFNATGDVNSTNVDASGTVTASSVSAGSLTTSGTVTASSVATGGLTASGNVSAGSVAASGNVTAAGGIATNGNINSGGTVTCGSVVATGVSTQNISVAGAVTVAGNVDTRRLRYLGTRALTLERSGLMTDLARGRPVSITSGTMMGGGPTNEFAAGSYWIPSGSSSSMTVDLGTQLPVAQIAWESSWREDFRYVPEWEGSDAYLLQYGTDLNNLTSVLPVAPVAGDLFVHDLDPEATFRYIRLTIRAPRSGNEVHIAMFRALSVVAGDSTAIDARRLFTPLGIGALRLWGQGRPGIARYGKGAAVETDLCANGNVRFGLSEIRAWWEGAAAVCPTGTWVCTAAERGAGECLTSRAGGNCNGLRLQAGSPPSCINFPTGAHLAFVADVGNQAGQEGVAISESGASDADTLNAKRALPVWCCSY
jgi:hypothetical protein